MSVIERDFVLRKDLSITSTIHGSLGSVSINIYTNVFVSKGFSNPL